MKSNGVSMNLKPIKRTSHRTSVNIDKLMLLQPNDPGLGTMLESVSFDLTILKQKRFDLSHYKRKERDQVAKLINLCRREIDDNLDEFN